MNLLELAYSVPWLMEPGALEALLDAGESLYAAPHADRLVHAQSGEPNRQRPRIQKRDGVAIIPVNGPIFRHASMFDALCGATSTESIAKDLGLALADPQYHSILLDVNSPGGEANGIEELASMIREARGKKPIVAYTGGLAASAAYWIASGAAEIVAGKTAFLGSIGAVAAYRDASKAKERMGIRDREFVSSVSPKKRPDLETDEGRAQIQARIDALGDLFVDGVAKNRGVDRQKVLDKFGQGDVLVAARAVRAGMADRVGTFEKTLKDLSASGGRYRPSRKAAASGGAMPTLRERLHALLGRAEEEGLDVEVSEDVPTSDPVAAAPDPEAARLREENERLRAADRERFEAQVLKDAEGFVAGLAGKAIPAMHAALADLYVQAALDDRGDGGHRVATLTGLAGAMPAHDLTQAATVNEDLEVLGPPTPSDPYQAAYDATVRAELAREKL